MNVHFVIHEEYEGPGAYLNWVEKGGHTHSMTRLYLGESLPNSIENIDMLVILGGPQNPATTIQECSYFDAQAEKALLFDAIYKNKIVIGVCLGAQLIGEALGANYKISPEKEIGVFPITLTNDGIMNSKFSHFGFSLDVGHWHQDMPGLTEESKVLATSAGCPRQIVKYKNYVYGFQCHMEFTPEAVEQLLSNCKDQLNDATSSPFVQSPAEIREYDFTKMNNALYEFLDKLVEIYKKNN
ncbi:glutamine amidotransferase-related protein [Myroides injenensis]|uniref:glutamine amidotransferase-related protein n=1 Tax=Myroides injenensis TaxID=1183151 RepID=UPI000288ADE5|nr:hypothetical protein [Myroides injenensis]